MEEAEQQIGSSPQASKATIQQRAHFLFTGWSSVFETLFDIAMAIFFRVQFRSIGRSFFNQGFRMLIKIGFGDLAASVGRNSGAGTSIGTVAGALNIARCRVVAFGYCYNISARVGKLYTLEEALDFSRPPAVDDVPLG